MSDAQRTALDELDHSYPSALYHRRLGTEVVGPLTVIYERHDSAERPASWFIFSDGFTAEAGTVCPTCGDADPTACEH